ncbi:hypothetical protein DEDE109153_04695 [Deinococcus deserti]|uniref:Uncharacterized protein n=1 Tax=Deinococcus deserti (strain DSM 17065 / CIP 109153 / LMG 22923 / VCD115) TaxID=546414 RepID=X5HN09_DEIDV|nr:hypothetical protein Deide_06812 [Deinococcus deserti VCD115]
MKASGQGSGSGASPTASAVGARSAAPSGIDLELLSRKVYALIMEDLRLDLARREGKLR